MCTCFIAAIKGSLYTRVFYSSIRFIVSFVFHVAQMSDSWEEGSVFITKGSPRLGDRMAATVREKAPTQSSVFDLDYSSTSVHLQLICLGFGFYAFTFLVSHVLSALLSHTYRSLSAKEKVWDIQSVCIRTLNLIKTCTFCCPCGRRLIRSDSASWIFVSGLMGTWIFLFKCHVG